MKPSAEFVNKVVKQGNSLCVRIPATVKKELKLEEGKEVCVSIIPKDYLYDYDEKMIQGLLNIAKRVKKLNKYGEVKQRFFATLNFEFLKTTNIKDQKARRKKQIEFIKEEKKEFGAKLIDEFLDWAMTLNKEAFITEEDGTLILKQEYRV